MEQLPQRFEPSKEDGAQLFSIVPDLERGVAVFSAANAMTKSHLKVV